MNMLYIIYTVSQITWFTNDILQVSDHTVLTILHQTNFMELQHTLFNRNIYNNIK